MFHPKKIVTVLGITTLLLSPIAPISGLFGDGAALAGNGKGGGNGAGGGNAGGGGGGNAGGAGKSSEAKAGGGKPANRQQTASVEGGQAKVKPGAAAGADRDLAANELGNMNGAMNANINAVLAHIRNGNTNGPIGAMAALVKADAGLGDLDAEEVLAREAAWQGYDQAITEALGDSYPDLDAYLAARQAEADYPGLAEQWQADFDAYQAAVTAGDPEAESLNPGDPPVDPDFTEIAALEDLVAAPPEGERPSEEDLAAVEAVSDAEAALLAMWNKNPDSSDDLTEEEAALLDALRARFSDADLEQIAAATGG